MSGKQGDLSPKQEAALEEFQERLKDVEKPSEDDSYLLRWLRARSFDVGKSEKMLRDHLRWRHQVGADNILKTWNCPEVLRLYYPGGLYGYDKKGNPIYIENLGYGDFKGILHSVRKTEIINMKIYMCETIWSLVNQQSQKMGRQVAGLVIIFDMEKYGLKHLWKPAVDVYNEVLTLFEAHYPETLYTCYIINAPQIFPVVYRMLKPFLSEETQRKVQILGRHWKDKLLEDIDADQLPVYWGGTATDPDGDPKCRSKIGIGGDVPKEFYMKQNKLEALENVTIVTVGRGASFRVNTDVCDAGTVIRWSFRTEGHDIAFGLFQKPLGDTSNPVIEKMTQILPIRRVNSHMVPEDGNYICDSSGTYVLYFDNTYSWMKGKKLAYNVETLSPEKLPHLAPSADHKPARTSSEIS